jgi:RNA 2',3'-cyclic 3'-phosphodiesterase
MASIRTFIAVNLAPGMSGKVEDLIRRLQSVQGQGVKWSGRDQMHFTLAFLGDVPEDDLPRVLAIARQAAAGAESFRLRLGGLGVFPARGAARVVWLGVRQGAEEMGRLQQRLAAGLRQGQFALEERPFVPHLTLARIRPGGRLEPQVLQADTLALAEDEAIVSVLNVMRSDLAPAGARYTLLEACPLAGG